MKDLVLSSWRHMLSSENTILHNVGPLTVLVQSELKPLTSTYLEHLSNRNSEGLEKVAEMCPTSRRRRGRERGEGRERGKGGEGKKCMNVGLKDHPRSRADGVS